METLQLKLRLRRATESSYRTYEEWKPGEEVITWRRLTSFLPYLWGMETALPSMYGRLHLRSYRTYEEWKQNEAINFITNTFQFLPYLWGMETFSISNVFVKPVSSYRTYEEWKQQAFPQLTSNYLKVLTVPMRNGNSPYSTKSLTRSRVLTVPMRNGNTQKTTR